MQVFHAPGNAAHDPKNFLVSGAPQPNPEVPARAEKLTAALGEAGIATAPPARFGTAPLAAVHTAEYLRFLETVYERWQKIPGASPEVVPNIHARARADAYPASVVGQAGYHMADTACPIAAGTWQAAVESAEVALSAAKAVAGGAAVAYGLCRPPGHHAYADQAGGFCYLNNAAIAAQWLRGGDGRPGHDRVAILDVDVHHGNGTQGIFYARGDVLTVSLHADPIAFYPFFWGHAQERGEGAGLGANLNLPLPRRTADDAYLKALDKGLERIAAFRPGALVVALGLDAHEGDPFEGLAITTAGFARIAAAVAGLGLPTVLIQEGGYLNEALGKNLVSFLEGFEKGRR